MFNYDVKYVSLVEALEYTDKLDFIVLPRFISETVNTEFSLTTFVDGMFFIVKDVSDKIEGYRNLRKGAVANFKLEDGTVKLTAVKRLEHQGNPRVGFEYNRGKGLKAFTGDKLKLFQGQSILIRGGHDTGKTTTATKIADGFENNGFHTYRLVIGQRRGDSLGDESLVIDSSSPIHHQLKEFLVVVDRVFRAAHMGQDSCLIIDSMDAFITNQSGEADTKLSRVLHFVYNLLRLSGNYTSGSLTFVCTTGNHNDKVNKRIGVELESFSDARIFLGEFASDGGLDYSRTPS